MVIEDIIMDKNNIIIVVGEFCDFVYIIIFLLFLLVLFVLYEVYSYYKWYFFCNEFDNYYFMFCFKLIEDMCKLSGVVDLLVLLKKVEL